MDYFIVYKPYGMLCQFTREAGRKSLADLGFEFPRDVYPVGRLDADSEGMIILTNDKSLNKTLLSPDKKVKKTYDVLLDGKVSDEQLEKLRAPMTISVDGVKHNCQFISVEIIDDPLIFPEIKLPVMQRHPSKLTWIKVRLEEGKNRQVRRMTAALGLPALRVFRCAIGGLEWKREDMGAVLRTSKSEILA